MADRPARRIPRTGRGLLPRRHRRLVVDTHPGLSPLLFGVLAIAVGVVGGVGAFVFRALIALVHNLAFLGRLSFCYDTNLHTPPGPFGLGIVLAPALGGLVVVFLVRNFAPEAKGHGVPEVMDAIYYGKSVIRPVVAVIKSIASAISIGTGGSVGREGPIVQISAAFASSAGRIARASRWQRATLVAAGGGAGIAATFNTPLGGALFAVEVLLHEVSVRTLVPVALASATATYVGRFLFGDTPAFPVPALSLSANARVELIPAGLVLGAVMALVSVAFIRALYGAEDLFEKKIPRHDYLRHVVGMLGVGLLFGGLYLWQGHYYAQGVGYATILDILTGTLAAGPLLAILFGAKLIATSLTLGSGASGGIFSPSLFMGATLGAACAVALRALVPGIDVNPAAYALIGMAAVVAGATGAALTAIVMIFEMTLDYSVVLPITLAAAVSYGLRRLLLSESIYTMKLARRGHVMPEALMANAHLVHHVADVTIDRATVLPAETPVARLAAAGPAGAPHVVVVADGVVVGLLPGDLARVHPEALRRARTVGEIADPGIVSVLPDTTIFDLLAAMQRSRAAAAVVLEPGADAAACVRGVITKAHLAEAMAEGMELFED